MKTLKNTNEYRAYTEDEARNMIADARMAAAANGQSVLAASYTYKAKKKKGAIVAEGWLVKITTSVDEFWDELEGEETA